jgi:hypothetical protein
MALLLAGLLALSTGVASASPGGKGDAGAKAAGPVAPAASEVTGPAAGPLPTAPPIESEDQELPEGHPSVSDQNPHAHAGGKGAGMPGVFEPPEDVEREDSALAPGTILVELHDADDHPVANEVVTLGILINSVAKGDTRKHMQATTDAKGVAVFSNLETASNIAYRVSSGYRGGSFAASPFQLGQVKSMHVVLHVYAVTRDLGSALIVCETVVAAELRDDRIQVEEALTVYNLGKTAWQPDDVRMALPEGYTAFNAQASMSDQGVDEANGGAKLRGTFAPGRHAVQFRWQLPWSGDKDVDFDVGLLPHVAIARVMMPATASVKLSAATFPPPEVRHDDQGQSFLVTERRLRPDDARLTSLSIGIHDLPTQGPGRLVASLIALSSIVAGLVIAGQGRRRREPPTDTDARRERKALLEELADLERAHSSGDVGPRTYEKARRELLESIARTLHVPA